MLPVVAVVAVALRRPGAIAVPWAAGSSGGMPGDAEEGIEMGLSLVLLLAPSGGAGCCPWPPLLPWR